MAHTNLLSNHIFMIVTIIFHDNWYRFRNGNAITGKTSPFGGVIRHETDTRKAQVGKDLCTDTIVALIRFETQFYIGINRIKSLILQGIGPEFIGKPDTSAFLAHIKNDTAAFFFNHAQSRTQLVSAVTAHGAQGIPRKTFGVDTDENVLFAGHIALDHSNMTQIIQIVFVANGPEIAVLTRQGHICNPVDHLFILLR